MKTRLIVLERAQSTQDVAREMAVHGEPEGVAVMALHQTGGRGRMGRRWISPPGKNLALSLILRPRLSTSEAALLGMTASVAVAETLESLGFSHVEVKWPNDVLLQGCKVAGILPEAKVTGSDLDFVIMGIGLNVNVRREDFPPELRDRVTSMAEVSNRQWDLEETARVLLDRLAALYDRALGEGARFIVPLWATRWPHLGKPLERSGTTGIAEGLTKDGALLLRTAGGRVVRIDAGEVNPVGMNMEAVSNP